MGSVSNVQKVTRQYGVEHVRSPPTVICLLPFPHHMQLFACTPHLLLEVCRLHHVPGAGGRGEQEPDRVLRPELRLQALRILQKTWGALCICLHFRVKEERDYVLLCCEAVHVEGCNNGTLS